MRKVLLAIALFFGIAFRSYAGDDEPALVPSWKSEFCVQVGTGFMPLHFALPGFGGLTYTLAEDGQEVSSDGAWHPVISLSFIWRPWRHTEFCFTGGLSWYHHGVTQYRVFGTDPDGKPRYDLNDGTSLGMRNSLFTPTLTVQCRHLWTPDRAVKLYSGGGFGLVPDDDADFKIVPLPAITPIGMRYGSRHIYFFLEYTFSPTASLLHGGLGWRF